jgi:hypothetical protein
MTRVRYSEFKDQIDLDAFEEAIGFIPLSSDRGWDNGHCIWPENHAHGDTTGKFGIHRDRQTYNCFKCGGGSLLSLVMELYDFGTEQATEWLYKFAKGGSSRSDSEWRDHLLGLLDEEERVERMPFFNERVLERFKGPVDYFRERGISDGVIEKYRLCYGEIVMKPAPFKGGEKISEDYYGPAAIIPHYWYGKLVGWQHRWLEYPETPRWLAKYTNTGEFPKHLTLFNYDEALKAIEPVVVCESVLTVLVLATYGFPAVSYFGGTPNPAQLRLMRRFSQGVTLAPDNDSVGDELLRIATPALERFIPVFHAEKVPLGPKADLGDFMKVSQPYRKLKDHLQNHVHQSGVTL